MYMPDFFIDLLLQMCNVQMQIIKELLKDD